jgi:hypothetical protein
VRGIKRELAGLFDCLVVLDILSKWGRADFYPEPKEVMSSANSYLSGVNGPGMSRWSRSRATLVASRTNKQMNKQS